MANDDDTGPAGDDPDTAEASSSDPDPATDQPGADDAPTDVSAADPAATGDATAGAGGEGPGPDEQYCSSCGEIIKRRAEICPHCGVRNRPAGGSSSGSKDRVTAGVLAILLGWFGAHKFYLGDTGLGLLYLCFFWTGIPALVGLVEGILYLTKTDEEFQQAYVD